MKRAETIQLMNDTTQDNATEFERQIEAMLRHTRELAAANRAKPGPGQRIEDGESNMAARGRQPDRRKPRLYNPADRD